MSIVGYINVALETFGGLLSLIFILCLVPARPKRDSLERLFIRLLVCNTALLFCDAAAWLFKGRMDDFSYYAVRIANFLVFALGYVILMLFTHYFVSYLRRKSFHIGHWPMRIICGISIFGIILVVINQFIPTLYVIDAANIYRRQSGFVFSQIVGFMGMLVNAILLFKTSGGLKLRERIAFGAYMLLPAAALLFNMLVYSVAVLYLATTICLLCIYISIQTELAREVAQGELELEKSRTTLMLSQIQPHFLYNTLEGIGELCIAAPEQAEKAITEFSLFLRGNIDSISAAGTIPFALELSHTRHYLQLEQMRFDTRLNVEYQIEVSEFQIPPLSLQPIVENAVRHGVMVKEMGGTVVIRAQETKDNWIVSVIDDGVGFDTARPLAAERAHIGIESVRLRVGAMCAGTFEIESTPQCGTRATITIPKK